MSSEALERAEKLERIRYDLTLPCQSQFIRNDAEWLLAEVARLEQERDAEAELFNEAQAALAVAREREQRAVDALRYIAGYDVAGYDAHLRSEDVARAALVDEPAAATFAGEGGVKESSPARRSADVTSEAERRAASLASSTSPPAASAAADEPGETP